MLQQHVEIINRLGLHARASAKLSQLAGSYTCEVWLTRNQQRVNAKSIMGVMMLAASQGTRITIETDGSDEVAALQALVTLVAERFGESDYPWGALHESQPSRHWRR